MEGHRIPDNVELVNKEWFNMGCIPKTPPEYIKDITLEEFERNK